MEPLKEMFNAAFYQQFAASFSKEYKNFNTGGFIADVTDGLAARALNERLRHTSVVLKKYLPRDYKKAIEVMFRVAPQLRTGYTSLVLPDFVGLYGKDDFDLSMDALKYFTQFGSSEFAVREFLRDDFGKTIKVMTRWAADDNYHVRRLASEGSRPRLPWSFKLEEIIKRPQLTQGILEQLKADDELYVRKSVANHLNDISKHDPAFMMRLIKSWDASDPRTRWIIKHASRTLIKKGHQESMRVFSFEKNPRVDIEKFRLNSSSLTIGGSVQLEFELVSKKTTPQKLVIDFAVHYARPSGVLSRKVFKLKELTLLPGQRAYLKKGKAFADLTTRKHHPGKHIFEILVNGKKMGEKSFTLNLATSEQIKK